MPPSKPHNHVTEAMEANRKAMMRGTPGHPEVSKSLVEWLEASFPPRCLAPNETVEDHLRYAGKVELVAAIKARFEETADWTTEDDT